MAGQEERSQENQSIEGGSGWGVLALSSKPLSKWGPVSAPLPRVRARVETRVRGWQAGREAVICAKAPCCIPSSQALTGYETPGQTN